MKYAMVDGVKVEASKGAIGTCPSCGSPLVAKCGEIRIDHWSHKGERVCDPWWENETEWHRSWKGRFPAEWQEVVQFDSTGEKHIADVKTNLDWVLEFQHSFLDPNERRARNAFYGKLVWVVDCARRKTDWPQFLRIISDSQIVAPKYGIRKLHFPEECRIIKEWQDTNSLVFFDFHGLEKSIQNDMWFLFPKTSDNVAFVAPFGRSGFLEHQLNGTFDEFFKNVISPARDLLGKSTQTSYVSRNIDMHQFLLRSRGRGLRPRRRF